MSSTDIDVDAYTKPFQLTKSMHRNIYPAIDPANPALKATGKVVIITGAGAGIGCDIAVAWATAGASGIILVGRSLSSLNKTARIVEAINKQVKVLVHCTDVTAQRDVQALYDKIIESDFKVDVLINNAGHLNNANIGETEPSLWWNDFEVNVKGPFLMIHHFTKHFTQGTIINMTTAAASLAVPGLSSYIASKLAMLKVAECIGLEYPNLHIFSIAPGLVETAMMQPVFAPFAKDPGIMTGGLSLYLASPKAKDLSRGFYSVNWDMDEMEQHEEEIKDEKLLKLAFLNGELGPAGHSWKA